MDINYAFKLQQLLLITNVNGSMEVRKNKILGPLKPIIIHDNVDEAMAFVRLSRATLSTLRDV
jgi:acyl-CoA reductase-like NAD-dependent aldehyde dehydrogenase